MPRPPSSTKWGKACLLAGEPFKAYLAAQSHATQEGIELDELRACRVPPKAATTPACCAICPVPLFVRGSKLLESKKIKQRRTGARLVAKAREWAARL